MKDLIVNMIIAYIAIILTVPNEEMITQIFVGVGAIIAVRVAMYTLREW